MKRRYCRLCGDLAGYSENICRECFGAEVNQALVERGRARPGERNPPEYQAAYAEALARDRAKQEQRERVEAN